MEWWNDLVRWLSSSDGEAVISNVVVPAVAIIVAGLLAAWIARGAVKQLLAKHDRELKISAIAALIDAAEQASVWNSLTPQEQILADRATGQSDIQVRLLPIKGADVAANWAAHALAQMKRDSATFGYQVEPAVFEFRDRLIEWQQKPGRAKRVFQSDLERWATEDESSERELLAQQDAWVAQQHHNQFAAPSDSAPASASAGSASTSPYAKPQQASGTPAGAYESQRLPTASTVIAPAAPLPPTHEPRPTVQQVAAGTGSRGAAQSSGSVATAEASPIGDLELTTDPGEARAAGEIPPPVNAFPPRKVGSE
ncbi:hypothetical protein N1028_00560 [Herbiconiux sp. CPCC 203407]|uniref:Uncharacterized protein n=1 Tax=Herbiconiux oxytropis TaxID=2970915 RepID=A0AA41XDR7_9MICO|nr:hypothetical protein [Herbiconiux oxytropis]MCS5720903.1 hypothetical protein [Herbiconiux oxytropis]MCS5724380.1 hypothetical protein [Herbiconiux oxytropis]